ncbi:hypothetical protein [Trinickia diaoshuihuensis]|uniref:hypothetical protein n=1 Tax=Trinickia diaoshuihuensis TaxID=2292265 RepID=UPI0013C2B33C|nr:hypothetical protein [Trinickia diaoshuihuensis]
MESTFSAEYTTARQADGSLLITYRNKGHHAPGFTGHIALLTLPAAFYLLITAAVLYSASLVGVVMLGLFVWAVVFIARGIRRSVIVVPQQGIKRGNLKPKYSTTG